jgi:hypothetical protein
MIGGSLNDVLDTIAINAALAVSAVRKTVTEMQGEIDKRDMQIRTLTTEIVELKSAALKAKAQP